MTIKDIYLKELAEIKKVLQTRSKYFLIAFCIGFVLLLVILFYMFTNANSQRSEMLKQQQEKLDELTRQQKQIAEQDRLRDSIYYETYLKNQKQREGQLQQTKKRTDEIINRINQPDFNADSIRLWWANN